MRSGCEAAQTGGCRGGGETRRLHGGTMEPPHDRRLLLHFATVPCSLPPSQLQVMLADGCSLPTDQQAAVAASQSGGKACPLSLLQPEKALLLARWQCLLEDKAQLTALLQLARGACCCKQCMCHDQQQRCGSVLRASRMCGNRTHSGRKRAAVRSTRAHKGGMNRQAHMPGTGHRHDRSLTRTSGLVILCRVKPAGWVGHPK